MIVSNNLLLRLFFFLLSVVMPSGFALFFVECFIRLHMLEIIGIEPDGPLVGLSRWAIDLATRTRDLTR